MVTIDEAISIYQTHHSHYFLAGVNNVVCQWTKLKHLGLCDRVIDYIIYGSHQDRQVKKGYFKYKSDTLVPAEIELKKLPNILRTYTSFEDLHQEMYKRLLAIPKIGDLTIYDAALRLGFMLSPHVLPKKKVYVFAGAWEGLKNLQAYSARLGLGLFPTPINTPGIYDISLFTKAFGNLPSMFIEDFLCVFDNILSDLDNMEYDDLLDGIRFLGVRPSIDDCFAYNFNLK